MKTDEFIKLGQRTYGRKHWKSKLASDLGVNVATVHRMVHRAEVPGPYEVALKAIAVNAADRIKLEKAARKLLPKKPRKRRTRKGVPVPQRAVKPKRMPLIEPKVEI